MATNELRAKVTFWDDWDFTGQRQPRFGDRPRPIAFEINARVSDDTDTRVTVEINPAQARMIWHSLGEYVMNGWRVSAPTPD